MGYRALRYSFAALVAAWVVGMLLYRKDETRENLIRTFNAVYSSGKWDRGADGRGTSGPGSTLEATSEYRAFLESFIKKNDVRSVVDAGCGDWTFSSAIDWGPARYTGIDISTDVIAGVRKRYARDTVKFEVGDITQSLPAADLLLCKDVLQHLPNELVQRFIVNNLKPGKYKWAIITNDKGPDNRNIQAGEHRFVDLGMPPFHVQGLVDLPVRFADAGAKVAQLLDLGRP